MKPYNHKVCIKCSVLTSHCVEYKATVGKDGYLRYTLTESSITMANMPYTRVICLSKNLKLIRGLAAKMLRSYRNQLPTEGIYDHYTFYVS